MNDAQKAALAALFGITPETHRHLYRQHCSSCEDGYSSVNWVQHAPNALICSLCGEEYPVELVAPALDTAAGDDVFLAPFMRWCHARAMWPQVQGIPRTQPEWEVHIMCDGINFHKDSTKSMTLALLRACLAARVPEVVEIMEGET